MAATQIGFTFDDVRSLTATDKKRLAGQCAAILERLSQGPATNVELAAISLKYSGRVSDLRAVGYAIRAERLGGGLYRYHLEAQ